MASLLVQETGGVVVILPCALRATARSGAGLFAGALATPPVSASALALKLLVYFNDYFGQKYPLPKLDLIAAQYADGHQYKLDGLSVEYPDWHFNVRPSNTEPLLRLNLEAATPALMERKRDEVLALIRA